MLIIVVCASPNVLATKCWKKISSSSTLSSCSGINNSDCGLFCASSNVQCAKYSISILSNIGIITSFLLGNAEAARKVDPKKLEDVAAKVKEVDPKLLTSIIKGSANIFKNTKSAFSIFSAIKSLADLSSGANFDGKFKINN